MKFRKMKNQKEEIDELISKTLSKEEAEFYNELEEQSLVQMMLGVYQGRLKWIAILTAVIMLIVFGLAVYCLIRFLETEDVKEMIQWGAGMFGAMMATGFLKLFHWLQMDKNALIREIKKVEFQLSVLSSNLEKSRSK